ncbi:hypothetical protein V6N12_052346 [Hibiscus sabdariffa]|uniref:Uncharacterized protein n=1 Tax=Hibiscus sabdariffa TaxID=183260 RepID=A0ABR2GIJ8_9ROSI
MMNNLLRFYFKGTRCISGMMVEMSKLFSMTVSGMRHAPARPVNVSGIVLTFSRSDPFGMAATLLNQAYSINTSFKVLDKVQSMVKHGKSMAEKIIEKSKNFNGTTKEA